MQIVARSHLDYVAIPDRKGREGSSHEGKFLDERANFVLIGMKLKHTNARSCCHCVFAGGEEA